MLLSPECATYGLTGCACGQHRYREQVHDCPEFPKNQSLVQPVSGLRWLVLLHSTLFTPPPLPHTASSLSVGRGVGGQEKGVRSNEGLATGADCRGILVPRGSAFVWILPAFLKARVHVLGRRYLEVCCLPSLDPFNFGGGICIRSSRERGPTLCPADYLFHSLLGLDQTSVLAEPAGALGSDIMMGGAWCET